LGAIRASILFHISYEKDSNDFTHHAVSVDDSQHSHCYKKNQMKCKAKSAYRLRHQPVYTVRRTDFSALEFERVEKAHFLRYTLATIVLSFGNLTKLSHSLFGFVPDNSLLDKCPYYRVPSPEEAPNVPRSLKWVVSTREKIAREKPSVSKKRADHLAQIHFSKKRYKRDNLTIPGMVVLYNTLLAWMMFHIEMGATSL
jgi:hypothetical protein